MTNIDTFKQLCRRVISSLLVYSLLAAGLATAIATPAGATQLSASIQQQVSWHVNDDPTLHGANWQAGDPASASNGYGPSKYFGGSNYAYLSRDIDPTSHWAQWDMGTRIGTQEIEVFIPHRLATAQTRYGITVGSSTTHTDLIAQREIYGWHSLGRVSTNGNRTRIEVRWEDSRQDQEANSWLLGVDALRMRCVSNCGLGPTPPPPQPQNLRAAVHEVNKLNITWRSPTGDGSSIDRYKVQISRPAIRDHPDHRDAPPWNPNPWYEDGTSTITAGLRRNVAYKITVTAVSEGNILGVPSDIYMTIPSGRAYIDDEPILRGRSSINCTLGSTKSCWKHHPDGPLSYNTYFKRPNDKEFIIERRVTANDFWGTNGFHVVYIDPEKRQKAIWEFPSVVEGSYDVGIYLPDVYNNDSRQPGAIVRYRVEVDDRRVLIKQIDQSRYHNKGGRWIDLGEIETRSSSKVEIFVSSYWPDDTRSDSYAAKPSGTADWTYHLAADAARLMPSDGVVDWSRLGTLHDEAVSWCQVDAFITLFIEPLYNVLKAMAVDRALDAAIVLAGAAVTAATGGTAAPVAAVAVAARIGLSVKATLTLVRIVQYLRTAYRFLEKAKTIADYVDGLDTLDTLISNVGAIITDPTGETGYSTNLDVLCNIEKVWENYYGEQSFWDRFKTRLVEWFGKVIEWVT